MENKLKSDTPETDAASDRIEIGLNHYWMVDAEFAQKLERERDYALECQSKEVERLRAAIRNLRDVSGRHHTQIACERLFALLPENETSPSVGATE